MAGLDLEIRRKAEPHAAEGLTDVADRCPVVSLECTVIVALRRVVLGQAILERWSHESDVNSTRSDRASGLPTGRECLRQNVLAPGADADELDRHFELTLDELHVEARGLGQLLAACGAAEGLAPAGKGLPDRRGVVEVALVRREVRGLRSVAQAGSGRRREARRSRRRTSSFVRAREVMPLTRTAS